MHTTFNDLLRNRRSVRKFKNKPVPQDILTSVIQDSTLAPSSGNEQPWQFIIVSSPSFMAEISEDCKRALLDRIEKKPADYAVKYKSLLSKKEYNIFYNAPALVFIIGNGLLKNSEINCTLAAGYFMFSAVTHGLGTCWINFAKFIRSKRILQKLGMPADYFIVAPIIIGYPEKIPPAPLRKPAEIIRMIGNGPAG